MNLQSLWVCCSCWGHEEKKENISSQPLAEHLMAPVGFDQCWSLLAAAVGTCTMEQKCRHEHAGVAYWSEQSLELLPCSTVQSPGEKSRTSPQYPVLPNCLRKNPKLSELSNGKWDDAELCGHLNQIPQSPAICTRVRRVPPPSGAETGTGESSQNFSDSSAVQLFPVLFTSKNTPRQTFVYRINYICQSYICFYFSWGGCVCVCIFAFPIWQVPAAQKTQWPYGARSSKKGQQQVIALIQLPDTADINSVELNSWESLSTTSKTPLTSYWSTQNWGQTMQKVAVLFWQTWISSIQIVSHPDSILKSCKRCTFGRT